MINYHGFLKNSSFFEGWYLKHEKDGRAVSFIPSIHITASGRKSAFIQVITNENSYQITYPYSDFRAAKDRFVIAIGTNYFTERGIKIDIATPELQCRGRIQYNVFTPPYSDIMGFFRYFPAMECNHGILSLSHQLYGNLTINGTEYSFDNGIGYAEKDWGTSFPKKYLWVQSNRFEEEPCSITASVADIPIGPLTLQGCICCIYWRGKEYRMATYNGAKVIAADRDCLILKRGKNILKITMDGNQPLNLLAPVNGAMCRTIQENICCNARFTFFHDNIPVFDLHSNRTSYEFAE